MRTCEDSGQPNDRGWSMGNEARRYCLCATARLCPTSRASSRKTYQRNRAHDREYHRHRRAQRAGLHHEGGTYDSHGNPPRRQPGNTARDSASSASHAGN